MTGLLVSVITPFFNAAPYLAEAIDSVLAQGYCPLELLLADDGSTDGGADVVRRLAGTSDGVRLLRLPGNQGPAAARNVALRQARGALLTFLDADDAMLPDRIAFQVEYLGAHPDVDVVVGAAECVLEPGVDPPPWLRDLGPSRRQHRYSYAMTMLARRTAFERVGFFDPSYRVGEDTEWMLRARAAGLVVARLDRVMIRRRIHGANLTYRTEEMRSAIQRTVLRLARNRIATWKRDT